MSSNNSFSINTTSSDCFVLNMEGFIPWNNPHNLISAETEARVERVKSAIVLPVFFFIGGPANLINMVVFYKQGLKDRINFCLFALSAADELYMIQCMIFNGERLFQLFGTERYGPVFSALINSNMATLFSLTWISQFMSAIIATERCLCVLWPLKFQTILRTKTMAIFMLCSCVAIITLYSIFVATKYRIGCASDPTTNYTFKVWTGSEFYYENQEVWDFMDSVVFGVIIPGSVTIIVIVSTLLTAVKLRQMAHWRAESTSSSKSLSAREIALTRMLVYTSVLFLVCISPISVFRTVLIFVPELSAGNIYHNTHFAVLWCAEITSYVNSSCNIFIYLVMGSKYRETLKDMFSWKKKAVVNN
ncbi:hypothetical protein ACOMHN_027050 [Nucella lapillus]